MIMGEKPS
jgi:hypothetical protein